MLICTYQQQNNFTWTSIVVFQTSAISMNMNGRFPIKTIEAYPEPSTIPRTVEEMNDNIRKQVRKIKQQTVHYILLRKGRGWSRLLINNYLITDNLLLLNTTLKLKTNVVSNFVKIWSVEIDTSSLGHPVWFDTVPTCGHIQLVSI